MAGIGKDRQERSLSSWFVSVCWVGEWLGSQGEVGIGEFWTGVEGRRGMFR